MDTNIVGNINGTPKEYVFWVYDGKTLQPKASIVMPDDTVIHNELMGEHYLQFSSNYDKKIDFVRTDYIKYNGIRYTMRRNHQPQEANLQNYKSTLKFEAPEMLLQDIIAFYLFQNYKEVEWTLTGTATQFMQIAVAAVNDYLGQEEYTVGVVEPTDIINISFDGDNVFDCLTTIAETFNAEWYLDYETNTVNLVAHHELGDIVTLRREVSLIDIQQSNENDAEYCTRLYAFGSTRNIPSNYRTAQNGEAVDAIVQKKLRLPIEVGDYIDAFPNMDTLDVIPKVKIFDHIYPKRIGTITAMRSVEKKDDDGKPFIIYYFKDLGLKFDSKYILPGQTLMLSFGENSWLSGRDFELKYHDKAEEFEIINDQSLEQVVPNDIIKPRVGDFFTLYNFDISLVGDQYVVEAEKELEVEARKWLEHVSADNTTYICPVNPVYKNENNLDLPIGQRVRLRSLLFDDGQKVSRVFGYDKYPATYKDSYIIGDKPKYSRFAKVDKNIAENKKITDLQYLEAMKIANGAYKNVKAMNYLRTALENETVIDKGLLLTTLIRLGAMRGTEWQEVAGINGAAIDANDVVAYFGGSLDDAINGVASIVFKMDGSGHLAKGNISWSSSGELVVNGTIISTDEYGNKLIMDATNNAFVIKNKVGTTIGRWYYTNPEFNPSGPTDAIESRLILDGYVSGNGNNTRVTRSTLTPGSLTFYDGEGSINALFSGGTVIVSKLPTDKFGLRPGQLWRDGEVVKVFIE